MMISPRIITGIPVFKEPHFGTAFILLKKSTALPTTKASMNMASPIGSFKAISISRIAYETAIEKESTRTVPSDSQKDPERFVPGLLMRSFKS